MKPLVSSKRITGGGFTKPVVSLSVATEWRRIRAVSRPSPPYFTLLAEISQIQEAIKRLDGHLKRLETQMLRWMHDADITDDVIGTVLGISSQAVGKKRRRRI